MERVLAGVTATLQVTFYGDETAVNADGAVTVTITRPDGTALVTNAATTKPPSTTGIYQYATSRPTVDILKAVWTGTFSGQVQSLTTYIEFVGGYIFALGEGRASDASLADTVKYPTTKLRDRRDEVEADFAKITGRSFTPRFGRVALDGDASAWLMLPQYGVTNLLSITVDGVALTAPELALCTVSLPGVLFRDSGWSEGSQNVIVEYQYGDPYPPDDIRREALIYFRTLLHAPHSGTPDRATSFIAENGGQFTLATPGRAGFETGVPSVDAVLERHTVDPPGFY